jgi:hydrophobic/amphiphilic exporter-1 (mainly G- bacteria), HAE1 family
MGISVVGGLLVSQLLTLYITPVIYIYLDKVDLALKRRLNPAVEEHDIHEDHEPRAPHAVAAE